MKAIKNNLPILDTTNRIFQNFYYKKPVTLKRALYDIFETSSMNDGIMSEKEQIKQFITDLKDEKIGQKKISKIIGAGSSSIAFETPMGDVLKISHQNPFVENRPIQDFDAKIFKKGKYKNSYYLLEEKLDKVNFIEDDNPAIQVAEKIKEKGFKVHDLWDMQTWQVGRSKNGQLKLLDHECAQFKSKKHKIKTIFKTIINELLGKKNR